MRRMVSVLVAAVLLAVGLAVLVERDAVLARLPLPPRDDVRAHLLDDGLPVFVVHRPDGDVRVLDARSPHRPRPWSHLVGWCPSSGVFEDPWYGSRFPWTGHWMGGPAPVGLTPFAARVSDGIVLVGPPGRPPPRDDPAYPPDGRAVGPSCLTAPSPYPAANDGLLLHDALMPDHVPWLDEAVAEGDGRWTPATGAVLELAGEPARLCRRASGEPPTCERAVRWGHHPLHEGHAWSLATGHFLVQARRGRVQGLIALAETDHDLRLVGFERLSGLATRVTQTDPSELVLEMPGEEHTSLPLAANVVVWGKVRLSGREEPRLSSPAALRELLDREPSPLPVWVEIERATGLVTVIEERARP